MSGPPIFLGTEYRTSLKRSEASSSSVANNTQPTLRGDGQELDDEVLIVLLLFLR